MKKNKKIVKYKRPFNINIGVIIFVIIFIYLVFNVFSYLTATHISDYEVGQGTIAENNIYKGLILRDEQVYTSAYTGALNYYVKEASKVSYNNLIYSVDENGSVSQMINEANQDSSGLDAETLSELEETILDFQASYDSLSFYQVYSFKENMDAALTEALSLNALNSLSDYVANAQNNSTFHPVTADAAGIVVYYTDGYESVTVDNFTSDMFDEASYNRTSSKKNGTIQAGEAAYKLITDEAWTIVIPIEERLANELSEDDTLQLRFIKDEKTAYATYTMTQKEGQTYLLLTLRNSMVRYAKDRYIEIELLLTEETGLKIPNSAITEKEFFTIPVEYFVKGGDSGSEGLLIERMDSKGKTTTEFVSPTIYYETEEFYYIDSEDVSINERIIKPDSTETYAVGTATATLKGVYNINKGYAFFKQIDILFQNEEYTIVKTGTTYGIALYDHIALDGTKVSENELIK